MANTNLEETLSLLLSSLQARNLVPGRGIGEAEIHQAEHRTGVKFPIELRRLLNRVNGMPGHCDEMLRLWSIEEIESFESVYGVHPQLQGSTWLIIGDHFMNAHLFVLDVREESGDSGAVLCVNGAAKIVASDLEEFLRRLIFEPEGLVDYSVDTELTELL